MADKPVYEQVQDLLNSWNAPPSDHSLERIVGVPTEPGDTRATAHVPMEELNRGFTQHYTDDGDDDGGSAGVDPRIPLDSLNKAELQDRIDALNEDRDPDDHLSKSGNKADLVARIQEALDEQDEDDADDDGEDDSDDE